MSDNDYYNRGTGGAEAFTTARAANLNDELDDIEAGFDKIPDESYVKNGTISNGVDSGAVNAYAVTMTHTPTAYSDGMLVIFKPLYSNTTAAPTVNVDSLGAKTITRYNGDPLADGEMVAGKFVAMRYNSTAGKFETQTSINVSEFAADAGVLVSAGDTTPGYLDGKLLAEPGRLTLTKGSAGADETLTVSIDEIDDISFFHSIAF